MSIVFIVLGTLLACFSAEPGSLGLLIVGLLLVTVGFAGISGQLRVVDIHHGLTPWGDSVFPTAFTALRALS